MRPTLQEDSVASVTSISSLSSSPNGKRKSAGLKFHNPKDLLMSAHALVKNRTGSVLARQMILKSDHFETGINPMLDIHLHGAPNFRMADLNVFGVAQPTLPGIKTILNLLQCNPESGVGETALWVSAREEPMIYLNRKPFVIRDAKQPLKNISTYHGIWTSRLEQMEERLKDDIIRELHRWNGLILVHEERSDSTVQPIWMAIEHIQTPRQVFESLKEEGYRVDYERIPIAPEQAPEDRYIDEFLQKITSRSTICPLIFNCGIGVGRTTCSMVLAILIRRSQMLMNKESDPFHVKNVSSVSQESQSQNEGMVDLICLLGEAFSNAGNNRSALEWAMSRSPLLGDLKDAMSGKFRMVLQLCSILQYGTKSKQILDTAIDRCAILVNLRKIILSNRIRYSISGDQAFLDKAVGYLERYLFLLSLCSYLQEQSSFQDPELKFSQWLEKKPDVWNMLTRLRNTHPPLSLFRPAEDLSVFSSNIEKSGLSAWGPHSTQPATELDKYVIKARIGNVLVQNTILKEDFWFKSKKTHDTLKGASNFRKIEGFPVYGVAQPTIQGVKNVLTSIYQKTPNILWINLREEPFIYINGVPYVLRDTTVTLRNLKSYSGITPTTLEIIEKKLKKDVVKELEIYNGKILLHTEADNGSIIPIWEDCTPDAVLSLSEAMELVRKEMIANGDQRNDDLPEIAENENRMVFNLTYFRNPQTAESKPDASDLDSLIRILKDINLKTTSVVLNCQIGLGRSTMGTITTSLIMNWLSQTSLDDSPSPLRGSLILSSFFNYQVIHSLLRVVRNGIECKNIVDQVIDRCGKFINMRDTIEEYRQQSETEEDSVLISNYREKGLLALERYFWIILFQNYLDQNSPSLTFNNLLTFKEWLARHPEFETIRDELKSDLIDPLVPVNEMEPGDGIAMTNEVIDVVNRRKGAVVSQGTIVKFDLFPGAQKLSLPDRIEGAHNFRKVIINELPLLNDEDPVRFSCAVTDVTGVGMPTKEGIKAILRHMKPGYGGNPPPTVFYWTSLREEPVLYIKGRPYVLRLLTDPIKNLVTTGIAKNRVEEMENQMKKDMIQDMHLYNNRVLLHEERIEGSKYLVVPVWETVKEEDIETPLDVYNSIVAEGFQIDYLRIPITDELSPIPDVFNQMVDRILGLPLDSEPIFNCQMGRGRTTQGLVITYLMKIIVGKNSLVKDPDFFLPDEVDGVDQFMLHSPNTTADGVDASLERGYKGGQYNLVLQLIAVLRYGKLAKYFTDIAIDACDHMQNLRIAIYDYRIRLAALPMVSEKYQMTFVMGCNYLVRYFYLITFADYLIEEWSPYQREQMETPISFSKWLSYRREIQNIIKTPSLD